MELVGDLPGGGRVGLEGSVGELAADEVEEVGAEIVIDD